MEIHAPDHPITSWRETAKHLLIVTAGVLIALGLEGVVAWGDHRLLVREATANLKAEIRKNKTELEGLFVNLERMRKEFDAADDVAQVLLEGGKTDHLALALNWNFAELKNAAVTTGQITGAFGYMDYDQVRRFADVYDLQAQFMRLQERQSQEFQSVFGFIGRIGARQRPSPAVIEDWRSHLLAAEAGLTFQEQIGRALIKRYDELLK